MSASSRAFVELVLLGPTNDRRQLQDSPVLGDVWIAYARKPSSAIDLLMTPHRTSPAGPVAMRISERIKKLKMEREDDESSKIAYLQGLVAAKLFFEELLRVVVPMTTWWNEDKVQKQLKKDFATGSRLKKRVQTILDWVQAENEDKKAEAAEGFIEFTGLDRYISLAAIILWAARENKTKNLTLSADEALAQLTKSDPVAQPIGDVFKAMPGVPKRSSTKAPNGDEEKRRIWQISLNRKALPALERSVPAVKGDAARTLFSVNCSKINWAVLDSGIDGNHPAFGTGKKSRIVKAFDFSNIREIVSLDNDDPGSEEFETRLNSLLKPSLKDNKHTREKATANLRELAKDAANDRPVHWEVVEQLSEIKPTTVPNGGHGTHVPAIIGASQAQPHCAHGMCPDINFYDFRVLAKTLEDTEFAIIAALQSLRYINERNPYPTIHGANLSLSIP